MADAADIPKLKTAVDLDVVGENILDIADFAIEKYEYRNDTKLSPEEREEAAARIREALWKLVEAGSSEDVRHRRQGHGGGGRRQIAVPGGWLEMPLPSRRGPIRTGAPCRIECKVLFTFCHTYFPLCRWTG